MVLIQKKLKRSREDRTSQNSKGLELPSGCVWPILSYRAVLEEQGFEPTTKRFGIIPESSDEMLVFLMSMILESCRVFCVKCLTAVLSIMTQAMMGSVHVCSL